MTMGNEQSIAKGNLSSSMASDDEPVIEILGRERYNIAENLTAVLVELAEVAQLPNPFEVHPGNNETIISDASSIAIEEVVRASKIDDSSSPEISLVARRATPVLAKNAEQARGYLTVEVVKSNRELEAIQKELGAIDAKDTIKAVASLPSLFDRSETVAMGLITEQQLKDWDKLLDIEDDAADLDGLAVTLQHKPQLQKQLEKIYAEYLARLLKKRPAEDLLDNYVKLKIQAENEGRKNWRVRRAHRSADKLDDDMGAVERVSSYRQSVYDRGVNIHKQITALACDAAEEPASQLFDLLWEVKSQTLGAKQFGEGFAQDGHSRLTDAMATEKYLAEKTKMVEVVFRQIGIKLNEEGRRMLHQLKDEKLGRSINRLANAAIRQETNPYDGLEADIDFRHQCRVLRDILAGGGRLDYPGAQKMANDLHNVELLNGSTKHLEPAESGLIAGIVNGQLDTIIAMVGRFEEAVETEDAQIEKLKWEVPEQFKAVNGFDLDGCARKLRALLADNRNRLAVVVAIGRPGVENQLLSALDQILQRHELRPDQAESDQSDTEIDEASVVENEPISEYDDDLELINSEFANIARQLDWEVFPPGTNIEGIRQNLAEGQVDVTRVNWDRVGHLIKLANQYQGLIYRSKERNLGTSVPYLVAEITVLGHRIGIAECPQIGNATYIVDELSAAASWTEVMQLTKADARDLGARRLIHPKETGHLTKIVNSINSLLTVKP